MPLEAPNLDDRTFEDLLLEAQRRIPRYAPEWTDFNDSDPGMTLVQLFAWFTELMVYRLNQVPDRNYVKFLQLLNLERRPAAPATVHVTFTADGVPVPPTLPPHSQVGGGTGADGQPLVFETEIALDFVPYKLGDVQVFDGDFQVVTPANARSDKSFSPLGWQPQPNNALYLGFAPLKKGDPTVLGTFPDRIRLRVFLPLKPLTGPVSYDGTPQAGVPPVRLVWEYHSVADPTNWRPLRSFDDETGAFTREGYLEIEGPADAIATSEGKVQGKDSERYWIRCRLASGSYPTDQIPLVGFIRTNTAEAVNLITVTEEEIGVPDGVTGDFALAHQPVAAGSLQLVLRSTTGGVTVDEPWEEVEAFLASTRDDAHYVLNLARGTVQFGDGERGRIPEPGQDRSLVALTYRYGGGAAGNVRAGSVTAPPNVLNVTVTNERPGAGGSDEQSVDDLKQRAPQYLRARGRAVTADDFKQAAEAVPGVVKATVLPQRLPEYPGVNVPGAVTVVIVPDDAPAPTSPKPQPSPDLLEVTFAALDKVRLLTTELRVTGPRYRNVEVDVDLLLATTASVSDTKRRVEQAIRDFLSPVPVAARPAPAGAQVSVPAAPASTAALGWDFGKRLYLSDLYAQVLGVTDEIGGKPVLAVSRLALRIDGVAVDDVDTKGTFDSDQLPSCGAVNVNVPAEGA